jgi:hypothetical protein
MEGGGSNQLLAPAEMQYESQIETQGLYKTFYEDTVIRTWLDNHGTAVAQT